MSYIKVADITDFESTNMKKFDLNGLEITVVHSKDKFFAFEDRCPHMNSPLHLGKFDEDEITCPFHKAKFNVVTGEKISEPKIPIPKVVKMGNLMHSIRTGDLKTFKVTIENTSIFIDL